MGSSGLVRIACFLLLRWGFRGDTLARLSTVGRVVRSFRPTPSRDSILLHLARDVRIGGYVADINDRTASNLVRFFGLMGPEIHVDFGRTDWNQWWRLRYPRQVWSPVPQRWSRFGLVVTDDPNRVACRYDAMWTLRYVLAPEPPGDPLACHLPYQMSPMLLMSQGEPRGLDKLRASPRPIRILFAGSTTKELYDRVDYLGGRFGKQTRWALLEHLRSHGRLVEVTSRRELDRLIARGCSSGMVMVDSARVEVSPETWLELLATADFFFCPPGQIMPLCHNIVEAMAVGTIPITNYAEWLLPPLVDSREALVFDTLPSLDTAVGRALAMDRDDIARMRLAVSGYHDEHLDCRRVAKRLAARRHEPLRLTITDEVFHRVEAVPATFSSDCRGR